MLFRSQIQADVTQVTENDIIKVLINYETVPEPTTATLRQKCEKYFDILYLEEEIASLYFDSPLDVLRHIKSSGTNGLKPLQWTFSKLKSFEKFYLENFKENNKVKLTYNPIFVVLRAKM